jgi:hypothetical protein
MTNAMAADEQPLWASVTRLAQLRDDDLVPIVLHISADENRRRLQDPGREGGKLKSVAILDSLRASHVLLVPEHPNTLEVDVSDLSAADAATHIARHLDRLRRKMI